MQKQKRLISAERRRALLRKRKHLMVERRQKWYRLTEREG